MNNVLSDNRQYLAMTAEAADALLQEIVNLTVEDVKLAATHEKKLNAIKAEFKEKSGEINIIIDEKAKELEEYIKVHPERFIKPRARKTVFGSYGYRKVSGVKILDKNAVIAAARAQALDILKETISIKKKNVEKAINEGHDIPGAQILSGERIFYAAKKELIDQAKA